MSKILICCAVFDTDSNKRTAYTIATFLSLIKTINKETTEIVFIDNASCDKTKKFLKSIEHYEGIHVLTNDKNVGTAEAINLGIHKYASKDTYCIKMDNDVTVVEYGWADKLARVIEKDPSIGVLGLKRRDLPNQPDSKEYPTKLEFIHHEIGDIWDVVEICEDIIGTVHMYNPKLLENVGYLWQPSQYGWDDCLMCLRSSLYGFRNAFYPSIEIDHIDTTPNPYWEYKRKITHMYWNKFEEAKEEFINGKRPLYYSPFD